AVLPWRCGSPRWPLPRRLALRLVLDTVVEAGETRVGLFVVFFLPQRFKYRFFLLGVFFHFGIVMVHGLTAFWLAMSGGLILYLLRLDLNISENWKYLKEAIKTTITFSEEITTRSQSQQVPKQEQLETY
ncbi:MAG: hypothetical protein AAF391_13115, partial [Bacteroidota bacterium]